MIGNYCVTAIYLLVLGGFYLVASGLYVAAVLPGSMCAALDGRHPRWLMYSYLEALPVAHVCEYQL